MARNGSDDATRRSTTGVEQVEGLLAYAQTQPRWGQGAMKNAMKAVSLSRDLAARDPAEHTQLLVRSLRTTARLLLRRRRAEEALPLALEAVALARPARGAPLVTCLSTLAEVYEALQRFGEAAEAATEAAKAVDPPG
ncbi:hypothetical protein ABZ297_09820 [Nonomuraea sp. NPDC005983]|uniref:hypothetical protein n=1 Tax=Nonomuraea sp. NPDC005983 TaxID=3155595 RepID=UPI0033B616AB